LQRSLRYTENLVDGETGFQARHDFDAVLELHQALTDHEQYMRFFLAHPAYLAKFARKVVDCNTTHCAQGAFAGRRLIGVANYAASDEPGVAEAAIAVAHDQHQRGVATALLWWLGKVAAENGIRSFTADILTQNTAMRRVLADAGWRHTAEFDGPVLKVAIELSDLKRP
jgi:RimJ/RimL family protein N-acetyltransferase